MSASMGSGTSTSSNSQEYTIRVPKNTNKKYHVMRFTSDRDIDFRKWNNVKMERENNMKEFKGFEEEQPKFGAGSEFGREQREEARRKKYGIVTRRYRPDDQPWLLKVGGKSGKKFKGIRDGGVGENAAYYVFTHSADGAIDAYPLQEWYNFQPIQRFKALNAEEAEEAYSKRNKTLNYFSLMTRKRLRPDAEEDGDDGEEGKKGKKGAAKKDLTISEMDEWMNSSDDSGSEKDGEEKDSDDEKKQKKKKEAAKKKKKKKKDSDDEAMEESDDGDEEGREHEYISDSSSSESEHEETKQLKGVAEEDALRKLLTSDEDSEEEKQGEGEDDAAESEDQAKDEDKKRKKKPKGKDTAAASKKKTKRKDDMGALLPGSSSDLSSDSSDADTKPIKKEAAGSSRSGTPTTSATTSSANAENGVKRKADAQPTTSPPVKKSRAEGSSEMEEAVRRYLARKPMTTTELLQKFKSKRTGMSSQQLVDVMTQILKRINPTKQTIKGKMYLSIKAALNNS